MRLNNRVISDSYHDYLIVSRLPCASGWSLSAARRARYDDRVDGSIGRRASGAAKRDVTTKQERARAVRSVVTVGSGRGIVVSGGSFDRRFVITRLHAFDQYDQEGTADELSMRSRHPNYDDVLDMLDCNGSMTVAGIVDCASQKGHTIDGAEIGRMVRDGLLVRRGQYITSPGTRS